MSKVRTGTWRVLILLPVALLLVAIPGLWMYMRATATRLHPKPNEVPTVTHSSPSPKWADAVQHGRQMVRASIAEQNLPGLSVAVGIGGDIVWAEGFGLADLDNRVSVTPNHRFRIGTASTVLTSAAAGLLLEEKRLNLDDVIQSYVPEYPVKQWPVTLRQLMGHLAGVKGDGGDEGPLLGEHCEHPVEALGQFGESPLRFQPGTQFRYTNYGWIIVSAAVESVAKEPFLKFMRERVFDPLGMQDTIPDSGALDSATKPVPNRVTSYFPRFSADPSYGLHVMRDVDYSCYAGSSVFLSTPSDMVRYGMAINGGKLLQRATAELLQRSQRLASGEETGYGLGWDLESVALAGKQTRMAGHDGEILGGMVVSLLTFPEHGMVVSVMSNISYADTFSLGVKISQTFAEQQRLPARK